MLKIVKRSLTIQDFIKMKKRKPFSTWRTAAKSANFGLMFGASASTFKQLLQESNFSVEDCTDYIKLMHAEDLYKDLCENGAKFSHGGLFRPEVEGKYLTAATLMRDSFLNGYVGLKNRISREHDFALKHYYTRMWYGAVRWHPQLAYMNIDPFTKKLKKGIPDQKYSSLLFTHLMNNSANAAVQSGETVFIYLGWVNADERMKLWKMKSKIFNTIHDSLDVYVWKPEKELIKSLINTCVGGKIRYPFEGIHHRMDPEISDIRDYEHLTGYKEGEFKEDSKIKGHFYKHGEEEKCIPMEEAIKNYNKEMGTSIAWKEMEF